MISNGLLNPYFDNRYIGLIFAAITKHTLYMKKLLLSIAAVATMATVSNAQVRFGGEVGLNMSNESMSPAPSPSPTMAIGARVGVIMDYAINDKFSIQPGVMFSMLGSKEDPVTETFNYIHIPINILYKFDLGPGKLFVGINPYLGYAVSAKISGGGVSQSITVGSDSTDLKALDFGIGIQAGYELPMGLLFRAGYDYGFANTSNESGETDHNTCIHISVGYLFGSNK